MLVKITDRKNLQNIIEIYLFWENTLRILSEIYGQIEWNRISKNKFLIRTREKKISPFI